LRGRLIIKEGKKRLFTEERFVTSGLYWTKRGNTHYI
jgi:hypothetical protein